MRSFGNTTWCIAVMTALMMAGTVTAQDDPFDQDIWDASEGDWFNDDNWVDSSGQLSLTPTLEDERWASFDNGGTAIVESDASAGALRIDQGTVDIRQGGSMTIDETDFTSGITSIGSGSTLRLSGNASFSGKDLSNNGLIELNGPDVEFGLSGNLDHAGELHLGVTDGGTPSINVNGDVTLRGSVAPTFTGVTPGLGDSFEFISGASSLADVGANLVLPDSVVLQRGTTAGLSTTNSSAAISIRNVPVLSVDRASGSATISNIVGDPLQITGYSIHSDSGKLNPEAWSSLADQNVEGWNEANPQDVAIAEVTLGDPHTLEAGGDALNLGNLYEGGATHPRDEDVRFEVTLEEGVVLGGPVEYTGPPNNLALLVNPETGEAAISNGSTFTDPFDVTGYNIMSESGALNPETWTSLEDSGAAGWMEANPSSNALAELNPTESEVFGNGDQIALGGIFNVGGLQDLVFEFTTVTADSVLEGTIVYGEFGPPTGLAGDINGDGTVNFPDFLILSANFGMAGGASDGDLNDDGQIGFPDFLILSANFGQSAGAAAAAVPEPSSLGLIGLGGLLLLARRRRR